MENGAMLIKGYKFSVLRCVSSEGLMFIMETIFKVLYCIPESCFEHRAGMFSPWKSQQTTHYVRWRICYLTVFLETFYNIYLYKNDHIVHLKLTLYRNKLKENIKGRIMSIEAGITFVVHISGAGEKHLVYSSWALMYMDSVTVVPRL